MEYVIEKNGLVWGGTDWCLNLPQAKVFKSRSRAKAVADVNEGRVVPKCVSLLRMVRTPTRDALQRNVK